MPQEFTVILTDEQAAQARELPEHWGVTLDEAVRRVVSTGIDISMMGKENDEEQANPRPRQIGPSGDLDDDIPL